MPLKPFFLSKTTGKKPLDTIRFSMSQNDTGSIHLAAVKTWKYIQVGFLLHIMTLSGLVTTLLFFPDAEFFTSQKQPHISYSSGWLNLFGLGLVIFSQMDAYSRFQDYKLAKDLLFENGFRIRVARLFMASRCQRDALKVAAKDLGLLIELNTFINDMGYKWFHIIPEILLTRPLVLFSFRFWRKTLFAPHYQPKHFLW